MNVELKFEKRFMPYVLFLFVGLLFYWLLISISDDPYYSIRTEQFVGIPGLIILFIVAWFIATIYRTKDAHKLAKNLTLISWAYLFLCWYTLFGIMTMCQPKPHPLIVSLLLAFMLSVAFANLYALLFIENQKTGSVVVRLFFSLILILLSLQFIAANTNLHKMWTPKEQYHTCPEMFTMPAGMTAYGYYLSSETDKVEISIVNGMAPLVVTNMSCTKDEKQFEPLDERISMGVGEKHTFILHCNEYDGKPIDFENGDSFQGRIQFEYYFEEAGRLHIEEVGPDYKRTISTSIYVKARAS